jgi:hypothetical protein
VLVQEVTECIWRPSLTILHKSACALNPKGKEVRRSRLVARPSHYFYERLYSLPGSLCQLQLAANSRSNSHNTCMTHVFNSMSVTGIL